MSGRFSLIARLFSAVAGRSAAWAGHWATFVSALLLVNLSALSGTFFAFSDTCQLVFNSVSTISTGLMVFLIQNTQNRDAMAVHVKLDELMRPTRDADDTLIDAEDELEEQQRYAQL
jgi:low affinity Fe/Cu permease